MSFLSADWAIPVIKCICDSKHFSALFEGCGITAPEVDEKQTSRD
jgi:hypothetical protein